jgi:hypothetical protein
MFLGDDDEPNIDPKNEEVIEAQYDNEYFF